MNLAQYRKKPVVIDAMEFDGSDVSAVAVAAWCGGTAIATDLAWCVEIATLEGVMTASPGDIVIRGVHGEFYPCKPDIFEATYEPVTP